MKNFITQLWKYIWGYVKKIWYGLPSFLGWCFVSFVISLIGVWLPCLIKSIEQNTVKDFFLNPNNKIYSDFLTTNPYFIYSITFITETYFSTIPFHILKSDNTAKYYYKCILTAICGLYIVVVASLIGVITVVSEIKELGNQRVFLWITMGIGTLLYFIRNDQRDGFGKMKKKREKEVRDIYESSRNGGDEDAAM